MGHLILILYWEFAQLLLTVSTELLFICRVMCVCVPFFVTCNCVSLHVCIREFVCMCLCACVLVFVSLCV